MRRRRSRASSRIPPTVWSSSTRARPRPRAARIVTCACGRERTATCCSAWRPSSCETSSSTTSSCGRAPGISTPCADALAGVDVGRDGAAAAASTRPRSSRPPPRWRRAESAAIFYDLGVEQAPFSTLISYLIRVLLVLTDNVGHKGGNVFYETLLPPVKDSGRKREPERALASGIPAIAALGNFGDVLADARARGGTPRSPGAPARDRRRRLESVPFLLRHGALARGARTARPARGDRAGHDRDRRGRRLRATHARRLREVGVRKLPEGLPGDLHAGAAADRSRPGRCAARAGDLRAARRSDGPLRRPCRPSSTSSRRARSTPTAPPRSSRRRSSSRRASRGSPRSACSSGATAPSARICRRPRSPRSGCSRT